MKQLIENVVQWGKARGLDKVGHLAQAKYTLKETAELLDAYADGDQAKMNDAIGDILVTLIVGASNNERIINNLSGYLLCNDYMNPQKYHENAFDVSYLQLTKFALDLRYFAKNGNVEYDAYRKCVNELDSCIGSINTIFNQSLSLKDCLQLAYDEIKDRTGKLVDGQFIKD